MNLILVIEWTRWMFYCCRMIQMVTILVPTVPILTLKIRNLAPWTGFSVHSSKSAMCDQINPKSIDCARLIKSLCRISGKLHSLSRTSFFTLQYNHSRNFIDLHSIMHDHTFVDSYCLHQIENVSGFCLFIHILIHKHISFYFDLKSIIYPTSWTDPMFNNWSELQCLWNYWWWIPFCLCSQ